MGQRNKWIGVTLCLMAMSFFAGAPLWRWIDKRAASTAMRARIQSLVEANPQLKPAWEVALEDNVLTEPEAKIILRAAGERFETGQ